MRKIVIDTYGADSGILPVIRGAALALHQQLPFFPVLVGPAQEICREMEVMGIPSHAYEAVDCRDYIRNDEPATCIFGGRDESSIAMSYGILRADPDCAAMISAGSTGALLVGSICRLGLLPGLKAPALASDLPCGPEAFLTLVDCGSNMECTVNDLVRYAKMGSILSRCDAGLENPRVGLLSVGREKGKGNVLTQQAWEQLRQLDLHFVGNVEGSDMVSGYADVVVADGFAGNVVLKCAEACGKTALTLAVEAARSAGASQAVIDAMTQAVLDRFEFNARGAAIFLGTRKTVLKMHGCATEETVVASVMQVLRLEKAGFRQALLQQMSC